MCSKIVVPHPTNLLFCGTVVALAVLMFNEVNSKFVIKIIIKKFKYNLGQS